MRTPPIRVRLTAWYVAVILITLGVSSLAMYFGIQKAIEKTVDRQLEARSARIESFLEAYHPAQASTTTQVLPAEAGLMASDDLYQITDASGTMLFQSAAMLELEIPLDVHVLQHHYRHHRDQGDFTTYYRRHDDVRVLASFV